MTFTAKDVQTLREKTGCGMMDCKKALTESDGDMDKAVDLLREKGLSAAAKKSSRIAAEGAVVAYTDAAKLVSVLLEVNCETDFVGKNEDFKSFAVQVAQAVAEQNPADVTALESAAMPGGLTVADAVREKVLVIGENIKIRRFARAEGVVSTYIHGGGRIGVMVRFDVSPELAAQPAFQEAARDVAMQVAAANPLFLNQASVPADTIEHEKKILTEQVLNEGKPAQIAEKIVMGKLAKYYKEACLTEQPFVKDGDVTVGQYIANVAKQLGGAVEITGFERFEKGEGLQKKQDNFAEEVAGMIQ